MQQLPLGASAFPAVPHDDAVEPADPGAYDEEPPPPPAARRPTLSRPLIPGSPPEEQPAAVPQHHRRRSPSPGGRAHAWAANLVQGGIAAASGGTDLTVSEAQRHFEAQAAFKAAQQRTSGAGSASLGLYVPPLPQYADRPSLPPGTAVLIGPPSTGPPRAHAPQQPPRGEFDASSSDHARVAMPHERPDGGATTTSSSAGGVLSQHLDSMFDVIHSQPPGISPEADDWAAIRMAERHASSAAGGGSTASRIAPARESTSLPLSTSASNGDTGASSAERMRAINTAAEAARQRLAALRAAHPDSFRPSSRALYTPWTDAEVGLKGGDASEISGIEEPEETHTVARYLGQRWRVVIAAAVVALTLILYARDVLTGAGSELSPTTAKLLSWHAGDAAGYEPPPPMPPLAPGMDAAPPAPDHHGLHLVVETDDALAADGKAAEEAAEHAEVDAAVEGDKENRRYLH